MNAVARSGRAGYWRARQEEQVHALVSALAGGERGKALAAIEQAAKADADMELFLELVLEALRANLPHPLRTRAPRLAPERARRGRILRPRKCRTWYVLH